MKKIMSIMFSVFLALTVCIPNTLAVTSMTKEKHQQFVNEIVKNVIIPFVEGIKGQSWAKEELASLSLEKGNINLEKQLKIVNKLVKKIDNFAEIFYSKREKKEKLGTTLQTFYNHVSNMSELLKNPLNCQGLSSYVLRKLLGEQLECSYVKFTTLDNDDHDVVMYKVGNDWYVCDLCKAIVAAITDKYSGLKLKIKAENLLSMPLSIYKEMLDCKDSESWQEVKITWDVLTMRQFLFYDHQFNDIDQALLINNLADNNKLEFVFN